MLQWRLQRETRYGKTFAPRPGRHLGAFLFFNSLSRGTWVPMTFVLSHIIIITSVIQ
jgi:hypothetical protein